MPILSSLRGCLLLGSLAVLSLFAWPAQAAGECDGSVGIDMPCLLTPGGTGVKQDFFGMVNGAAEPITPQRVAEYLAIAPPSYFPATANYQVMLDRFAPNGKLLVFLPGTYGFPQDYHLFAERAAQHGYHVVGLHYWNDPDDAKPELCKIYKDNHPSGDGTTAPYSVDGCITDLFDALFANLNVLTPVHKATATGRKLNTGDLVRSRLRRTLQFLTQNFPDQHWEQFAPGGDAANFELPPYIDWSKVTLAGHSTGSKLAAHIAQVVSVDRLIMLSGPNAHYTDANGVVQCPTSVGRIGATPLDRYYVYYNTTDPNHKEAETCFRALGLVVPRKLTIQDDYVPSGTHVLVNRSAASNDCSTNPNPSHNSTGPDCGVLDADQITVPAPRVTFDAWDYLLRP